MSDPPQFPLPDDAFAVGDTVTIHQPARYWGGLGAMAGSGATRGVIRSLADSDGDLSVEALDGNDVGARMYVLLEYLSPEPPPATRGATPRKETVDTNYNVGDRLHVAANAARGCANGCRSHPTGLDPDMTLVVAVSGRSDIGNYNVRAVDGSHPGREGTVHESYLTPDTNNEKEITMSQARTVIGAEFAAALQQREDEINAAFAAQVVADTKAIEEAEAFQARLGAWHTTVGGLLTAGELVSSEYGDLYWADKNRTEDVPRKPKFQDVDNLKAVRARRPQQQERHTATLVRSIELFTLVGPRETVITAEQYSDLMTALPTF
jgi:hypothetical protein